MMGGGVRKGMRGGVTRRPGTAARRGDALINFKLLKCPATGALDPGPEPGAPGPPGPRAPARAHARAQGPGPSSEFRVGSKGGRRGGRRQCTGKCSDSRRGAQDKASSFPPGAGRRARPRARPRAQDLKLNVQTWLSLEWVAEEEGERGRMYLVRGRRSWSGRGVWR